MAGLSIMNITSCSWCLREAPVQTIEEKLWLFWKLVSTEDPLLTSHKNICESCKLRYQEFSVYIEKCKVNASIIDEILSGRQVKTVPSIDIEYNPSFREETLEEKSNLLFNIADKPFKCPRCLKIFDALDDVYRHLRTHTVKWLLKCSICNKTVNWYSTLMNHLRSHMQGPKFKCPQCNKVFAKSANLKHHVTIHIGSKPFQCSLCNETFYHCCDLKTHSRVHIGNRPYECVYCDIMFAYLVDLKAHLYNDHTGENLFKCSLCKKTFPTSSRLKTHLLCYSSNSSP